MKGMLTPKIAEKIQNKMFRIMPPEKKLKITSQLILLAKKLKEAKEVIRKKK
jgi:hypothetical protein